MPPRGLRFLVILLTIIALVVVLYYGRPLILPLAIAGLLAMVLNPFLNWLISKGVPKALGIAACVVVFLSFFGLLIGLVVVQIKLMGEDWKTIEKRALDRVDNMQVYLEGKVGISSEAQDRALRRGLSQMGSDAAGMAGSVGTAIAKFFLTTIYMILLLAERTRIEKMVMRYSRPENRANSGFIMEESVNLAGKYMFGQLKIIGILTILYSVGFLICKVPYAIFLAGLAAVFSLIPFLGNVIGGGIAAAVALAISGPGPALGAIVVIAIVQITSDYILQPMIVGNSINLSPLATIFCVVAFGTLWGPLGAVLALPITGCMQTIFKQMPKLKPLAVFMGSIDQDEQGPKPDKTSEVKEEIKEKDDSPDDKDIKKEKKAKVGKEK